MKRTILFASTCSLVLSFVTSGAAQDLVRPPAAEPPPAKKPARKPAVSPRPTPRRPAAPPSDTPAAPDAPAAPAETPPVAEAKPEPPAVEPSPESKPQAEKETSEKETPAPETEPKSTEKPKIWLAGDDADFSAAVASELQAAGYDAAVAPDADTPADGDTVVALKRREDGTVGLRASVRDEVRTAEVGDADQRDGLDEEDVEAIRVAEAIRHLVDKKAPPEKRTSTPKKKRREKRKKAEPAIEMAPAAPLSPDAADGVGPRKMRPALRLGVQGAGGYFGIRTLNGTLNRPVAGLAFSARINFDDHFGLAAIFSGTEIFDDPEGVQPFDGRVFRLTGLATYEVNGASAKWTPVLGAGLYAEARTIDEIEIEDGLSRRHPLFDRFEYDDSAAAGLVASAGVTFSHPLRFRVDLLGFAELASSADGPEQEESRVVPSGMITFGIEYDFVRKPVLSKQTARR